VRAAFYRIDTLTIASVLPGIAGDYPVPRTAMECGTAQPGIDYVRSSLFVRLTSESGGVSFELDFHESKLKVIGVDDVVGDAGEAGIRSTRLQRCVSHARRILQSQGAARQGHNNIVMGVHVVSRVRPRRKTPFRHDHSFVLDLNRRCRFHDFPSDRPWINRARKPGSKRKNSPLASC
jgi:hypothetical protein